MKLTVKNFGPIREAKNIDVSPMTIFVGPSNTGKSYLAILIYSVTKALANERYHKDRLYHEIRRERNRKVHSDFVNQIKTPNKILTKEIEKNFLLWANGVSDSWKEQFFYCFGEEGINIIEEDDEIQQMHLTISDEKGRFFLDLNSPENSKLTKRGKLKLYSSIDSDFLEAIHDNIDVENSDENEELYWPRIARKYSELFFDKFFASLLSSAGVNTYTDQHYLPAIRGGIMQSHRTLVSTLIQLASGAGLRESSPIPLFNGVLSDFMQKLINIDAASVRGKIRRIRIQQYHRIRLGASDYKDQKHIMDEIGGAIEQEIMDGNIRVQMSDARYPDFSYVFERNDREYNLPLMNASSMVSELAPVSLFIRHYLQRGDLFILEEPEAHLHPAAQRKISKVLVRLVNAGIHVLLTTHSSTILEQVSNYIHASDIDETIDGQTLNKAKISVYFFNRSKRTKHKNTIVKSVTFDHETGFLTEDHLAVSSALYNENVSLLDGNENNDD